MISAAPFRDRVVHHALVRVLEPLFERRFVPDSYACRKGKGTHAAVHRAQRWTRRYRYCLRADIVRFSPSADHAVLLETVRRVVACSKTLDLVRVILEGGAKVLRAEFPGTPFPGDDLTALLRPRRLSIRNLTSQFLANAHLDPLDHFAKEQLRARGYVRYADDFRIFADSKEQLHEWRHALEGFLARLRLVLHDRKTQVQPWRAGVPFLGFSTWQSGHKNGSTCLRQGFGGAGLEHFAQQARPALAPLFCEPRPVLRGGGVVEVRPPGPPAFLLFVG